MRQSRVTIRYAKALLKLAIEQKILEQCYTDMILLQKICVESKEFSLLLKSPIIQTDKKLKILKEILDLKISAPIMQFVKIITTKKREALLGLIASSFINLYKTHNKTSSATAITAEPLDDLLRADVIDFIKKHGQENVELTEKVDPAIIGGAIIRIGDKQLDASVSKAIYELRQIFNKNLYIQDF